MVPVERYVHSYHSPVAVVGLRELVVIVGVGVGPRDVIAIEGAALVGVNVPSAPPLPVGVSGPTVAGLPAIGGSDVVGFSVGACDDGSNVDGAGNDGCRVDMLSLG